MTLQLPITLVSHRWKRVMKSTPPRTTRLQAQQGRLRAHQLRSLMVTRQRLLTWRWESSILSFVVHGSRWTCCRSIGMRRCAAGGMPLVAATDRLIGSISGQGGMSGTTTTQVDVAAAASAIDATAENEPNREASAAADADLRPAVAVAARGGDVNPTAGAAVIEAEGFGRCCQTLLLLAAAALPQSIATSAAGVLGLLLLLRPATMAAAAAAGAGEEELQ